MVIHGASGPSADRATWSDRRAPDDDVAQVRSLLSALIVDDDAQAAAVTSFTLETQGFTVHVADSRAPALQALRTHQLDLIVMEVLTGGEGMALCSLIRGHCDVPILILSALCRREDVITGLEHGADDYVTKPFHPREVALRARALVRRSHGTGTGPVERIGHLRIDPARHLVSIAGRPIELPTTEFKLLAHLAAHRGTPQSWRTLLCVVWGAQYPAGGRDIVKSAVYRLRSRLATSGDGTDYIVTLRGVGYVVPADLPATPSAAW